MATPQATEPQTGSSAGPPATTAEGSGSALSSALSSAMGAGSGNELSDASGNAAAAAAAATDRSASMSGALSGGSSPGLTPGRLPRWKGKRIGRYRLVDVLGKGSYGRVFLADDVDLHRQVALKIISAETTANSLRAEGQPQAQNQSAQTGATPAPATEQLENVAAKVVERTLSEARAAARIEHPNVVHVYEVGRLGPATGAPPGSPGLGGFIAMELLEGGTLQDIIKAHGPMDIGRACSLVADAAEALQFAHDQGVVHRDVKPANLMLSRHGRCKVVDFGLAMEHDPDPVRKTAIAGTLMFVSPEVTLGQPPSPKSDQYSLGVTLYTLLAGRPPYHGDRQQLLDGHRNGTPPSLRALRPQVDERLELAILRAMDKDPAKRFHHIRQFGQTLRSFSGEATAADAAASFLPDLLADLEDPTAPEPPPKRAIPPAPAVAPVVAASARSRSRSKGQQKSVVIWPWIVAGGVAVVLIIGLILAVSGVFSSSPDQNDRALAQVNPNPTPQRPHQTGVSNPPLGANRPANGANKPVEDPGQAPLSPRQDAQATPQKPTQADAKPAGNAAAELAPDDTGTDTPPEAPPTPPKSDAQNPVADQTPKQSSGQGSPTNQAPGKVINATVLSARDFPLLLRIANGGDEERPDRRAVVQGNVSAAGVQGDGTLRIEFAGSMPRRALIVSVDISNADLLLSLQKKLQSNAKDLGIQSKDVIVRGEVKGAAGGLSIVITSADQIELVPAGAEGATPPVPPQRGPPPNRNRGG